MSKLQKGVAALVIVILVVLAFLVGTGRLSFSPSFSLGKPARSGGGEKSKPADTKASIWYNSDGDNVSYQKQVQEGCIEKIIYLSASNNTFKQTGAKRQKSANGYVSILANDVCNSVLLTNMSGWFELQPGQLKISGSGNDMVAQLSAELVAHSFEGKGEGGEKTFPVQIKLSWDGTKSHSSCEGQWEQSDGRLGNYKNKGREAKAEGSIIYNGEDFGGSSTWANIGSGFNRFPAPETKPGEKG